MIESKVQIFPPTHSLLTDSTRFVILPSSQSSSQSSSLSSQSSLSDDPVSSQSQGSVRLVPGTKMTDAVRKKELAILRLARNRLDTFTRHKFPDIGVPFDKLAEGGFFCRPERPADQPDQVECIFCQVKISNWSPGMDPIEQHIKFSDRCEFIMGYNVKNIPIDGKTSSDPIRGCNRSRFREPDICGSGSSSTSSSPTPSAEQLPQSTTEPTVNFGLSQMRHQNPAFPRFVTTESRIRTFPPDWSSICPVSAERLAEAGFFYDGPVHDHDHGPVRDAVTCFHCKRIIFNWEAGDDPWSEHQRLVHSAGLDCYFLRLNCDRPTTGSSVRSSASAASIESNSEIVSSSSTRPNSGSSSPTSTSSVEEASSSSSSSEPTATASKPQSFAQMGRTLGSLASSYEKKEPAARDGRCKVCYDSDIEILFLPCRHATVCASCAASVDRCPYCRAHIDGSVRIYLS